MEHKLFANVDEMLTPKTLSKLTGEAITSVRRSPFDTDLAMSGNDLLAIETNRRERYVLKRMALTQDWIMQRSDDSQCRSVRIWQYGLLDQLKSKVDHSIIACAKDGEGWAIFMHDHSKGMFPHSNDRILPTADNELILDALAAQHATFWNSCELSKPKLGLCNLPALFGPTLPVNVEHLSSGRKDILLKGWEQLQNLVDPDVADILRILMADPQPLYEALAQLPQTLLHGDPQPKNLGVTNDRPQKAIMVDWQFAARGPATLDLAWYIRPNLPIPLDEAIEFYRRRLEYYLEHRFDEAEWPRLLELGLLGSFLRQGCAIAWHAMYDEIEQVRAFKLTEFPWWSEKIRTAVKWL